MKNNLYTVKQEIIEFYKNNSITATAKQFNTTNYYLTKFLKEIGVELRSKSEMYKLNGELSTKNTEAEFRNLIESISEEELVEYYLNNSFERTAKQFNLTKYQLDKVFNYFSIQKTDYRLKQSTVDSSKLNQDKRDEALKAKAPFDELVKYEKTHTTEECAQHFLITSYGLGRLFKLYNIQKTHAQKSNSEAMKQLWSQKDYRDSTLLRRLESCIDKFGGASPFCSEKVQQRKDETIYQRYGVTNIAKVPNLVANGTFKKYGVTSTSQLPEVRSKQVRSGKQSMSSDGKRFDSSWEANIYDYCLSNNIPVKTQIPIEYTYLNKQHTTFIDFLIYDNLYEVKGNHLLEGCFDYAGIPISAKMDVYKNNDVTILTDLSCFDVTKYPENNFLDIKSFNDNLGGYNL